MENQRTFGGFRYTTHGRKRAAERGVSHEAVKAAFAWGSIWMSRDKEIRRIDHDSVRRAGVTHEDIKLHLGVTVVSPRDHYVVVTVWQDDVEARR